MVSVGYRGIALMVSVWNFLCSYAYTKTCWRKSFSEAHLSLSATNLHKIVAVASILFDDFCLTCQQDLIEGSLQISSGEQLDDRRHLGDALLLDIRSCMSLKDVQIDDIDKNKPEPASCKPA